jgi:hypothetical protein
MSCCGRARGQIMEPRVSASRTGPPPVGHLSSPPPKVVFQYVGATAMAVVGPVSGRRYRFEGPGARAEVDARDRRFLVGVPNLRQT